MNPLLYGAGIAILIAALGISVGAIAATVWPNRHKIMSALRGQGRV
jgi:hypothetical protein